MNLTAMRHGGLLVLRWGIGIGITVLGLMVISELGQFLVWQLIGENVQHLEVTLQPAGWEAGVEQPATQVDAIMACVRVLMETVQ